MAPVSRRSAQDGVLIVARLAELQARMHGLAELRDVVGAMRSLAAVRVQQAEQTLLAIREYTSVIERALSECAPGAPVGPPPGAPPSWTGRPSVPSAGSAPGATGVVVFGSEHGFCGAYNDRVLDEALVRLRHERDRLLVVGSRAAMVAAERRHAVAWTCPMASHIGGVENVALRTAIEVSNGIGEGLTTVILVYARCSGEASSPVVAETLVPYDFRPSASDRRGSPPPLSNLGPRDLFGKLAEELTFARLARAATESFASENAARLAAMTSARENIENKLADLGRLEREGRQEEITTELLDIVTGAQAIAGA